MPLCTHTTLFLSFYLLISLFVKSTHKKGGCTEKMNVCIYVPIERTRETHSPLFIHMLQTTLVQVVVLSWCNKAHMCVGVYNIFSWRDFFCPSIHCHHRHYHHHTANWLFFIFNSLFFLLLSTFLFTELKDPFLSLFLFPWNSFFLVVFQLPNTLCEKVLFSLSACQWLLVGLSFFIKHGK